MASKIGRAVLLSLVEGTELTLLAAAKTKSLTWNDEPVDITSDDDAGWRKLLDDVSGTKSVDISIEGILKSTQLSAIAEAGLDVDLQFDVPTVRKWSGTFRLTSFEIGAETAEGATFSASFSSSGPVTGAASS